jgi:hypothetical protein
MVRTQVQLPDKLYEQARRLAEQKEISLAEVVRRGLEHLLTIYPVDRPSEWQLEAPANTELRQDPFAEPDWRWQLNVDLASAGAASPVRKAKGK